MNRKLTSGAISCLLTLLVCGNANAVEGDQDIDLAACDGALAPITWSAKVGDPAPNPINLKNSGGTVNWDQTSYSAGCGQTSVLGESPVTARCLPNGGTPEATGQVTLTAQLGASAVTQATFAGNITFASAGTSTFGLHVAKSGGAVCDRDFTLRVNSAGGGWGDPHLTTVDGVKYDFQSAGEFTALREPGLEIQTRQVPVSSASGGLNNEYTGLTTCVALYSAVAAKLGSSRVTLQPNGGGKPEDQMELRVDGKVVTLNRGGLDLTAEGKRNGHVEKVGDNIEITDVHGTRLVVTPNFWPDHGLWYLNVNVFDTTARQGTMGAIAPESWLPALPDGSSVGYRGEGDGDRYQQLYEKFADAWRVTDASSLFDYPAGKKTADFTLDEWPRNNPQSCALEGQAPAQPADQATAEAACAAIANPAHKADCIFDVRVTGFTGFAKSYADMKDLQPAPTGWQAPTTDTQQPPHDGGNDILKKWWWLILLLILILFILWRRKSAP